MNALGTSVSLCLAILSTGCNSRSAHTESANTVVDGVSRSEAGQQTDDGNPGPPEVEFAIETDFYTVAEYDEDQDIAADLKRTIDRATREQKLILLQVGGDWCIWCTRLAEFFSVDEGIRSVLSERFLVMRVSADSEQSSVFLADYPAIDAYPHLFVLSPDGTLLESKNAEAFEVGKTYDRESLLKFLVLWAAQWVVPAEKASSPTGPR